jgi:hypothetical protein
MTTTAPDGTTTAEKIALTSGNITATNFIIKVFHLVMIMLFLFMQKQELIEIYY